MTRDEIVELANQAGGILDREWIERFAKLVVEKEREACAKIAQEWVEAYPHPSKIIAKKIRERT